MSRDYDHGKNAYKKAHKIYDDQHTKHYLSNDYLSHYGANPENYRGFSSSNYRMGSIASNGRDTRIDNALIGEHFYNQGRGYDASRLAGAGISYNQQLQAIGNRFDRAKEAYDMTGEYKYYMMQKDLRSTAEAHLDADLRFFRLSNR
jgi:hypothetical protein